MHLNKMFLVINMKIRIPIQSFSDIITNSSSELFAVVDGNKDVVDEVYYLIDRLFGWNQESELTPCVEKHTRDEAKEDCCWRCSENGSRNPEDYPESWVEIELPYSLNNAKTFFVAGLEAVLKEKFGDNFQITYCEEL